MAGHPIYNPNSQNPNYPPSANGKQRFWNGPTNKYGNPISKGVGANDSAEIMAAWRAGIPLDQFRAQQADQASANNIDKTTAKQAYAAKSLLNAMKGQGVPGYGDGNQPGKPGAPAKTAPAPKAAAPPAAQPPATGGPQPKPTLPAPPLGQQAPPTPKGTPGTPPTPSAGPAAPNSTAPKPAANHAVTDGGVTMPFDEWIRQGKARQASGNIGPSPTEAAALPGAIAHVNDINRVNNGTAQPGPAMPGIAANGGGLPAQPTFVPPVPTPTPAQLTPRQPDPTATAMKAAGTQQYSPAPPGGVQPVQPKAPLGYAANMIFSPTDALHGTANPSDPKALLQGSAWAMKGSATPPVASPGFTMTNKTPTDLASQMKGMGMGATGTTTQPQTGAGFTEPSGTAKTPATAATTMQPQPNQGNDWQNWLKNRLTTNGGPAPANPALPKAA